MTGIATVRPETQTPYTWPVDPAEFLFDPTNAYQYEPPLTESDTWPRLQRVALTDKERSMHANSGRLFTTALGLALVVGVSGIIGCAATRHRREAPAPSGFLADYSQLGKVEGYDAHTVYIAPDVDWASYYAIHVDSVTLWTAEGSTGKLSDDEKQLLTDMLYASLHDALGKRFLMADRSGPHTIEVRAAITQARGANRPLNVATTVVPQLRVLSTIVGMAADTAVIVGSATVEIDVTDSLTDRRLAAATDSRAGTKALGRAFSKWADVKAAADFWAERVATFFVRQGVQQRS